MSQAIALFGKMLTFSRLKIKENDLATIKAELQTLLEQNPIANGLPIVIDSDVELELDVLMDVLWSLNVQPIGVVGGILDEQAKDLRLAIFPADGKRIERLPNTDSQKSEPAKTEAPKTENKPVEPENTAVVQAAAASTQSTTLLTAQDHGVRLQSGIHTNMLRSGQSLQHLGGDLTVIGGVNDGAEAITDNSLHIYGRGLGRLVAGATGDKDARIFCQKFNPSLVSVAGTYCLRDAIPAEMIDQAVQVTYDEEKGLIFTLLNQL